MLKKQAKRALLTIRAKGIKMIINRDKYAVIKNFTKVIGYLFLLSVVTPGFASQLQSKNKTNTVNILQWWGYLSSSDPYIKKIEKQCHARITYDQYYSNNAFLRRIKSGTSHYDIAIFSDNIFKAVKGQIKNSNSSLYKLTNNYHPIIKKHYDARNLPHNVVFFVHSLTGFLYKPSNAKLSRQDGVFDMFKKAKDKIVVMLDDPIEADFLLSLGLNTSHQSKANLFKKLDIVPLTVQNFKRLYKGTNFIITNLPERIVTKKDFAFAFQWSGDAIEIMKNNPGQLKFYIHPKLSYISSDLLANLNNKKATMCVAKKLGSKWFLHHEQNKTYYFSPYVDGSDIQDPYFKKVFQGWKNNLKTTPWVTSVNKRQFKKLRTQWDWIKLKISEQKNKV